MLLRSIEERFTSVDDKFKRQFEKKKFWSILLILFWPIGPKQRWYLSSRIRLELDQKEFFLI